MCISFFPLEYEPVLVIDTNTVISHELSFELFQAIAWRHSIDQVYEKLLAKQIGELFEQPWNQYH